jgi:hypothetical protein
VAQIQKFPGRIFADAARKTLTCGIRADSICNKGSRDHIAFLSLFLLRHGSLKSKDIN